jgi:NAD(P)-dependent dehydrogenase (short-subunit alcohol dehydrogenase family)
MGLDIMKLEKLKRLDILINTADAPPVPLDIDNATGVSTQMLVNHLGPMLFTITLLPLLKTTDKANNTPVDKMSELYMSTARHSSMLHSTVN